MIIGGGITGLSCAYRLHAEGIGFTLLEATECVGGRIKTDHKDGFLLDWGFQVLQTGYPEARRVLDFPQLDLHAFAPGAIFQVAGRRYTVADPLRRPKYIMQTMTAPIGSFRDRLRLLKLAHRVTTGRLEDLFQLPETTAMNFLRSEGFSETMIARFFVPFFGGVCLDPAIRASSRVLQYVLRMFAAGDVALPALGMEQIPKQLARHLSKENIRAGVRVRKIMDNRVVLDDGTSLLPRAIVVATEGPEAIRLLGLQQTATSVSETCLYFSSDDAAWHPPFLILNGDGTGPINNIAFPSKVSANYAPEGKSLISVVVLGNPDEDDVSLLTRVHDQLIGWFGKEAAIWEHLATYRITHALPDQSPPTMDPNGPISMPQPGLFIAGEHDGLPGIQWAMLSGRRAAEAVIEFLK
jgi:phytoene dehydrogenase-like protein